MTSSNAFQQTRTGDIMIDSFTGKYRFLSNFSPCIVTYEGMPYLSVEHAYQAAKTNDYNERKTVDWLNLTAGEAKKAGQTLTLRKDWDEVKLDIMDRLVRRKFKEPLYRNALMETGTEELIEGNTWGDTFWGVCNGVGENHLGKILMKIRAEYAKEEEDKLAWARQRLRKMYRDVV